MRFKNSASILIVFQSGSPPAIDIIGQDTVKSKNDRLVESSGKPVVACVDLLLLLLGICVFTYFKTGWTDKWLKCNRYTFTLVRGSSPGGPTIFL